MAAAPAGTIRALTVLARILMNNGNENYFEEDLRRQLADAFGLDVQRLLVFLSLYENAFLDCSLSSNVKHLIALAMVIGEHNWEAMSYHVNEALRGGATRDQIRETVIVAVLAAGAPSIPSGLEALAAVARFEAQKLLNRSYSS
jgi:alkylhydroperoxidase/carboxymuconolactone decarboxylase family protein YurZ